MHGTLGIFAFLWPRGPHLHRSGPAEIDVGGVESSWIMAQLSALWDEDESHWENVTSWKPVTLAESQIWNPKLRDLTSVATLIDQTRYYRSSLWKTSQNLFQLNPGHGPMVGCSLGSSYWFITAPFHGKFSRSYKFGSTNLNIFEQIFRMQGQHVAAIVMNSGQCFVQEWSIVTKDSTSPVPMFFLKGQQKNLTLICGRTQHSFVPSWIGHMRGDLDVEFEK